MGRTLVGALNLGLIGHASINANARTSQAIERFRECDESAHFIVSTCPPGESEEPLLDNKIHMAIGYFWHHVPALDYTTIFYETQFAHVGRGHPLFRKTGDVTPAQTLAHARAQCSYPLLEAVGSPAEWPVTAVADNMKAVAMLVLSGRHLGYLPEYFAVFYVAQGLLIPLAPATMRYEVPFGMAVRHGARRSDLLAAFITGMKAVHA